MKSTPQRAKLYGAVMEHIYNANVSRSDFARMMGVGTWRTAKSKLCGDSPLLFKEALTVADELGVSLDQLRAMI